MEPLRAHSSVQYAIDGTDELVRQLTLIGVIEFPVWMILINVDA